MDPAILLIVLILWFAAMFWLFAPSLSDLADSLADLAIGSSPISGTS
jgi:hypothetical protein